MIEVRRQADTPNVEVMFDGQWVGLAIVGTSSFGTYEKADRYRELAEEAMRLFLVAPALLEALEALLRAVREYGPMGPHLGEAILASDDAIAAAKGETA